MDKMAAIILAAGQGTRMKSSIPKVLHRIAGRPLVAFPVELGRKLGCKPVVAVVGHGREQVKDRLAEVFGEGKVEFAVQTEQKGTGHAVQSAMPQLRGHKGIVLILSGDVPLLDKASITKLQRAYKKHKAKVAFLSFCPESPKGYGRVIKEDGHPVAIREDKDCNKLEKSIGEVNSGVYLVEMDFLKKAIKGLKTDNAQGEFYLTDLVEEAAKKKAAICVQVSPEIVGGVNDRLDLAQMEDVLCRRINESLMRSGVTMRQPSTIRVDADVKIGADTEIEPGVQLLGKTKIGKSCKIEAGAVIIDSVVKDHATIKAYSVLEQASVGQRASVGPMGRLRPGTILGEESKVGNFVEIKNTILGKGSKASHLSYLGDGELGERVNIGAGTIFCNYNGYQKQKTILEDDVFIGSDSQLIAPVTVGKGAYVASGSTINKNVPADALAMSRAPQQNKKGIAAALRKRFKSLKEKETKGEK